MAFDLDDRTGIGFHPIGVAIEVLPLIVGNRPAVVSKKDIPQAGGNRGRLFRPDLIHLAAGRVGGIGLGQQRTSSGSRSGNRACAWASTHSVSADTFFGRILIQAPKTGASARLHAGIREIADAGLAAFRAVAFRHLSFRRLRVAAGLHRFLGATRNAHKGDAGHECQCDSEGCCAHTLSPLARM